MQCGCLFGGKDKMRGKKNKKEGIENEKKKEEEKNRGRY